MNEATFYADHWHEIDDERVARYGRMFEWHDAHATLLELLDLRVDSRVLDYGCGPGAIALGIARMICTSGRVYGVDINAQFIADATRRAAGFEHVSYGLVEDGRIPFADHAVDRLLCKNVMEYVPDVGATLAEFRRVVEPRGRILLIDSDWGFLVAEPWGRAKTERFFRAASPSFKTPEMGRALPAAVKDAGFEDVQVRLLAGADTEGRSLPLLRNMASYASKFQEMPVAEIDAMIAEAEAAVEMGRFLFCLPQFLVSARCP